MAEKTLAAFCEDKSQSAAAEIMGCSQSAVSQMIRSGRDIRIVENDAGELSYYEISRPKGQRRPKESAA